MLTVYFQLYLSIFFFFLNGQNILEVLMLNDQITKVCFGMK